MNEGYLFTASWLFFAVWIGALVAAYAVTFGAEIKTPSYSANRQGLTSERK